MKKVMVMLELDERAVDKAPRQDHLLIRKEYMKAMKNVRETNFGKAGLHSISYGFCL
jgi:hypothetical protein